MASILVIAWAVAILRAHSRRANPGSQRLNRRPWPDAGPIDGGRDDHAAQAGKVGVIDHDDVDQPVVAAKAPPAWPRSVT